MPEPGNVNRSKLVGTPTMHAVRLHAVGENPRLDEVTVPEPGPGRVRISMRACGICGSDLHLIDGSTAPGLLPLTLGHEPAGVIDKLGDGVAGLSAGQRVVVNSMVPCGQCRTCANGWRNVCERGRLSTPYRNASATRPETIVSLNLLAISSGVSLPSGRYHRYTMFTMPRSPLTTT